MYDDVCTNECFEDDPRYWCGRLKEDTSGKVMRCVQYTRYGEICVAECGGKHEYNWCLTNALKIDEGDWWDYCSLVGYTVNKKQCVNQCSRRGQNYFWCKSSATDSSEWDYCSPPGLVKPVQYTIYGEECISECKQHGENYYWCTKSLDYCTEDSCDDDWDYCSLNEYSDRFNYQCINRCSQKGGTSYYWCEKNDGGWDYCSPSPRLGVHVSDHVELTRYGAKCRDICATKGESYFWCSQHGGSVYNWWDYCSPSSNITINQEDCVDKCSTYGKSYHWCHTSNSWDYCSPVYVPGMGLGYENVAASTNLLTSSISCITAALASLTVSTITTGYK